METVVLRNPPDGPVLQFDAADYGKPLGVIPSGPRAGQVGPLTPGQMIGGVPLSSIRFVDKNTAVPTASQDGSIGAPFATLAAGYADCPASGTLLVVGADYSSEGVLSIGKNIAIQRFGATNPIVGEFDVTTGHILQCNGLNIGTVSTGTGALSILTDCTTSIISGTGTVDIHGGVSTSGIGCNTLTAEGATIVGAVTLGGTNCGLTDCFLPGPIVITFSGGAGVLTLNGRSWQQFELNGSSVVNGTTATDQFLKQGTFQLAGATPVDVAAAGITANNFVSVNLKTVGGAQGPVPTIVIGSNKFTATGTAGDTSTWAYRVQF